MNPQNSVNPTHDTTPATKRKGLAVGLSAGLVGGTLAGLAFGIPGVSGAAADDAPAAPLAAVQQVEPSDGDAADSVAPSEPGERLRETLQALVDDQTISADQADAVTSHLVENRPERADRGGRRGPGGRLGNMPGRDGSGGRIGNLLGRDGSGVVTDLLGIDSDELREQLRSGSTLAEIAEAQGVDTETLVAAMVDAIEVRIDEAIESGRIEADAAAEKLATLEEHITAGVNGERLARD